MISAALHNQFKILEAALFPKWQKADPVRRLEITKKLGEIEGKMILEEVNKEVKLKFYAR